MTASALAVEIEVDEDALDLTPLKNAEDEGKPVKKKWTPDNPLWKTFSSNSEIMEAAAEFGADMRMGLYVDLKGRRWKPRTPIVAEIMRRLGYGVAYTEYSRRPAWWPERGSQSFVDYVELKVQLRRESGIMRFEQIRPFMESLVGLAVVEMTRRLRMNPDAVTMRDLTDVLAKTTNILTHGEGGLPVQENGEPKSASGKDVYLTIINQAKESMPEGVAREQLMALFSDHMSKAQQAITAIPAVARRIEVRGRRQPRGA